MGTKKRGKIIQYDNNKGDLRYNDGGRDVVIPFETKFGTDLGLQLNQRVTFVDVVVNGTVMAASLNPIERGVITSIHTDTGTGILTDSAGNIISFEQEYCKELGLQTNDKVEYTLIFREGKPLATSLVKIERL